MVSFLRDLEKFGFGEEEDEVGLSLLFLSLLDRLKGLKSRNRKFVDCGSCLDGTLGGAGGAVERNCEG